MHTFTRPIAICGVERIGQNGNVSYGSRTALPGENRVDRHVVTGLHYFRWGVVEVVVTLISCDNMWRTTLF